MWIHFIRTAAFIKKFHYPTTTSVPTIATVYATPCIAVVVSFYPACHRRRNNIRFCRNARLQHRAKSPFLFPYFIMTRYLLDFTSITPRKRFLPLDKANETNNKGNCHRNGTHKGNQDKTVFKHLSVSFLSFLYLSVFVETCLSLAPYIAYPNTPRATQHKMRLPIATH